MAKNAWHMHDIGSNHLDLKGHDQVIREIDSTFGMVADGGRSREGENMRDGSADELEWVVFVTSCKQE